MSADKRIIVVVSPGDNVARDLIEKLNALSFERTVLVGTDMPFARVSPDGFPLILIRAVTELGCALVHPVFVDKHEPVWRRKGTRGRTHQRSVKSLTCPPRRKIRRFGNHHY